MDGISIIIPLYNKERSIQNTLKNILCQSNNNFEVIIVDDGSTDSSLEMLKPFLNKIKLLKQANQGPSAARNNGAKHAKFPILCFLDADDSIDKDFVMDHLDIRDKHPKIELSINSFEVYKENKLARNEKLLDRDPSISAEQNIKLFTEFNNSFVVNIASGSYCINKDIFDKCQGFDKELRCWEITDALIRFSLKAKHKAIINKTLTYIIEDAQSNSQYQREKTNIDQHRLFCNNLLSYIPELPRESKPHFFKEISVLCGKLWVKKEFKELSDLYRKTKLLPDADILFNPHPKIKFIVKIIGIFQNK